jgi:predicted nucleotidyltransferase
MTKPKTNLRAILRTLTRHRVEFIIVGGVAAVLQGAPLNTFDLDVVHRRESGNIDRLLKALQTLEARFRTPGAAKRRPERSHLSSVGHQLLMTRWGPLDLLGVIGAGRGYDELLHDAYEVRLGGSLALRVLGLPALIRDKQAVGRDKDKAALALLQRTLEEKQKSHA